MLHSSQHTLGDDVIAIGGKGSDWTGIIEDVTLNDLVATNCDVQRIWYRQD